MHQWANTYTYYNIRLNVCHVFLGVAEDTIAARAANSKVFRLVEAYRRYGHLNANVNPLHENCER